jgi:GntR family transcriptional repressor for pyruvate dehydrogenase complex
MVHWRGKYVAHENRGPTALPAIQNRTGQLIGILRGEIRANRLRPGERLATEQQLVTRFQVSRTVVREAIASLRAEGLVVTRQGAGAFVAEGAATRPFHIVAEDLRSLTEVQNVMQLRLAVEIEAAGIAAHNRDRRCIDKLGNCLDRIDDAIRAGGTAIDEDFAFHIAIAVTTGNPQFERFMRFLGSVIIPRQTLRVGMDDAEERRSYLTQIQTEHRAIYAAIRDADVEEARSATRLHLERARDRYIHFFEDGRGMGVSASPAAELPPAPQSSRAGAQPVAQRQARPGLATRVAAKRRGTPKSA